MSGQGPEDTFGLFNIVIFPNEKERDNAFTLEPLKLLLVVFGFYYWQASNYFYCN